MDSKPDLPTTTGASLPSAPRAEASTNSPSVRPPSIAPVTDDIDSEWLADDAAAPAGSEAFKVPLPPKLPSVAPPAATAVMPDAPIAVAAAAPAATTSVAAPAVVPPTE